MLHRETENRASILRWTEKLTIAGETFDRGFGTHAESSLLIKLNGKAHKFSALVGLDDEMKGHDPAVEFEIYGDNKSFGPAESCIWAIRQNPFQYL